MPPQQCATCRCTGSMHENKPAYMLPPQAFGTVARWACSMHSTPAATWMYDQCLQTASGHQLQQQNWLALIIGLAIVIMP
jgi:hypothetical protein